MRKLILAGLILFLILPALACQLVTGVDEATILPTPPSLIAIPTALNPPPTLSVTAVTAVTDTIPATVTIPATTPMPPPASCTYDVAFISDVTIPDDTQLVANSRFTKTWRIRNNGTCPWPENTTWVFHSDNQMNGVASSPVPALAVGKTADISLELTSPSIPGTYTGYWRVRLPDGTLLPARFFVRIIVLQPTPTTAVSIIDYFRANVTLADPGDIIQLQWRTNNNEPVTIYRLRGGQMSESWRLESTGTMDYHIDLNDRNEVSFALFGGRDNVTGNAQANLTVSLTCPYAWFFTPAPEECAQEAALFSDSVEQHFEHGVMIWVAAQDRIYILYDADQFPSRWETYMDVWEVGDPLDDPTIHPPTGLYQPVRGFGLIWREMPDVRSRLGWAIDLETAFTTVYQTTARYKYNETYLQALDGGVWHLLPERSNWDKLIVD